MNNKVTLLLIAIFSAVPQFSRGKSVVTEPNWGKYLMTGGLAIAIDTNKGLIYDQRAPRLTFTFEDKKGNRAKATFQCTLHSIGIMAGISINFYAAKMFSSHVTLKQAFERPIEFGIGFRPAIGLIAGAGVFLASVKNYGGCFCMFDIAFGPYAQFLNLITGGKLEMIGKPIFIDIEEDDVAEEDTQTQEKKKPTSKEEIEA
ncbi:hypothetical protein KAU11_04220 [Candidatus Babeliales bacterium]|nr:hypothetical protein [Candidatus Babeliales bacterium]